MQIYCQDRNQRVVFNGQVSNWADVTAGVCQESIQGTLLFLIYINDLATGLSSNAKSFADDTSLLSDTQNINTSANELNNDLDKINTCSLQWKMTFNADRSKLAQEVICSQKLKKINHLPLFLNNIQVSQSSSQKHFGIILDEQLTFYELLEMLTSKINKNIGLLQKLQNLLSRSTLRTIYKAFVRLHLDYGDIVYDETYNASFHDKFELF